MEKNMMKLKEFFRDRELKNQCSEPPTGVWGTVGLNDFVIITAVPSTKINRVY
jgi:hypothetical protein